ncbi:WcaI family glycosyltransferase [Burkholderia vietnamiensis]|uniref:WcaI family glycosyltransferase n=1 Tax=Burkholderia vietnamiensis TaxID=60552 RepID=UPI001CF12A0E|nr:WcaI family glycosyltransferase [Burkholderia vietnamiensis]MCA8230343.1 WcaI family glycosyltransferase [Burkholderia vietnamiensis]
MKILIYGINYAPEPAGIGEYTAEMAETLCEKGHTVRVVCAPPLFPQRQAANGDSLRRYEVEPRNRAMLWRVPLWIPSRAGGMRRIAHLASFALASLPGMLAHAIWRPDVVMCITPSLLNAPAGWIVARLAAAHAWIHIQHSAAAAPMSGGLLERSLFTRAVLAIERLLLKRFDTVSAISGKMVEHAMGNGIDPRKLVHFTNWADVHSIYPLRRPSELRATLYISPAATVVLYSGDMGTMQGLDILAEAAHRLVLRDNVIFVFCGNGSARAELLLRCVGLRNCRFLERQPHARLNELLNLADIHVIPQPAGARNLTMPLDLPRVFASGRAVVAVANPGTELHDVVASRGVVVQPGDSERLASAIDALAANAAERARLGQAGRKFAEAVLSRDTVLKKLDARLRALRPVSSNAGVPGARHPDF